MQADFTYMEFGESHNIFVHEATGFLYSVGTDTCSGGIHLVDLGSNPLDPDFAGCWKAEGYVHDLQCVVYGGPDTRYTGREICFTRVFVVS